MVVWLSLFTSGLSSSPYSDHLLSVNQSDKQTPANSEDVHRGCAWMCDGNTCWEPGTSQAEWERRPKKGGEGCKDCWKPSGKATCRKCHEHNCRRKTGSQLLLGKLAKGARPSRGWGEPLWDWLLSPPLDFKSKYLATRWWPPRVQGVHLLSPVWRKMNLWARFVTDLNPAAPSPMCWASSHPNQLTIYPSKFNLESTCLCLQNTEFCLIQRFLSLAFWTSENSMDYFEDGKKRH